MTAVGRREFLGVCGGAVASIATGACASLMVQRVAATGGQVRLSIAEHAELRARDGVLAVQPDGFTDPILILRLGDGRYAALSPICTHRGCTVEPSGDRLECPCHGSTYDREGKVLIGPAERALSRYPAVVEGDALVINVGGAR